MPTWVSYARLFRMRAKRRGVGLGTVLIVVALVGTLGMALSGLSIQHLNMMTRTLNRSQALDLARSAMAMGLERVLSDNEYGTPTKPGPSTLTFTDPDGQVGVLTFDAADASRLGIPVSINNLTGTGPVPSPDGQTIPHKSVHLVAIGKTRSGVTRTVECMLRLPPYPYAAASDFEIDASGIVVGGLDPGAPPGMPRGKLRPASLFSNSKSKQALDLGAGSTVSGDLLATGEIKVDKRAIVSGDIRPKQEERDLPRIKITDYDPIVKGRPYFPMQEVYPGGLVFTGEMRREGNLNVDGTMSMQGAVIYVNGAVRVAGALTGKGVLVATGDVTVNEHAELDAQDRIAIVSGKKLTLRGGGYRSSLIQGTLYSEGGFEADSLTLRGVLIARDGKNGGSGKVKLTNSQVIKDDGVVSVEVSSQTFGLEFSKKNWPLPKEAPPGFTPTPSPTATPPPGGGPVPVPPDPPEPEPPAPPDEEEPSPGPTGMPGGSGYWPPEPPYRPIKANFTRHADGLYTVDVEGYLSTTEEVPEDVICQQVADALGGLDPAAILVQLREAAKDESKHVGKKYKLGVKDPAQLLPMVEQARIMYWNER